MLQAAVTEEDLARVLRSDLSVEAGLRTLAAYDMMARGSISAVQGWRMAGGIPGDILPRWLIRNTQRDALLLLWSVPNAKIHRAIMGPLWTNRAAEVDDISVERAVFDDFWEDGVDDLHEISGGKAVQASQALITGYKADGAAIAVVVVAG